MCKTVRTYYVPYRFVGPFYALFCFLAMCIRQNANTCTVQSLGTLSLLTPSHPHCGHTLTPSLWAHSHSSHPHCGHTLTRSLWAHPHCGHTLTPSLWAHSHSSHPHCGHTLTRSHTHVHLCDPPSLLHSLCISTPSLLPSSPPTYLTVCPA